MVRHFQDICVRPVVACGDFVFDGLFDIAGEQKRTRLEGHAQNAGVIVGGVIARNVRAGGFENFDLRAAPRERVAAPEMPDTRAADVGNRLNLPPQLAIGRHAHP